MSRKKKRRSAEAHRAKCARGASPPARAERTARAAGPATALVWLPASTPGHSQAVSCAAPLASGSLGVRPAARSHPVAGTARPQRPTLGAAATALAATEAADRASGGRSSPDRGRHAVGRTHWLVLA